jgi:4-amino-4-deoxy-L-arabinose transferase-like glycosyltransferase
MEVEAPRVSRQVSWIIVLLLLLAAGLRFGGLAAQELRGDESFGVLFSTRSPQAIVSETISAVEPHPPLDYFILRGWMTLAGDSEFSVRFPSAVAGILAVAMAYALGHRMYGRAAGVAGAAFIAVSPIQIWHAQEARMYAISTALALATTLSLWEANRGNRRAPWVAYVLLTAVHCYLHYYAFFIALAQGIWALAAWRRERRRLAAFALAACSIVLLYVPWLVLAFPVLLAYHGNGDSPTLLAMLIRCLRAFSLGQTIQPATAALFVAAFGLLFVLGLYAAARTNGRATSLLGLWLGIPLAAVWIASLRRPVFDERYVMAATPPFYLFLGVGAAWLAQKKPYGRALLTLLVAACLTGGAWSLYNYYAVPDYSKTVGWRQVRDYLNAHASSGDVIVQNYPDPSLTYYYRGPVPLQVVPGHLESTQDEIQRTVDDLLGRYERIWFLPHPSPGWDPAGAVGQRLDGYADRTGDLMLGKIRLLAYLPLRESWAQMTPVEAMLGDAIRLRGYRLTGAAQPGGVLDLTLYWEATAPVDQDYTVFAHIVSDGETILAQEDHAPLEGAASTSTWKPGQQFVDHYRISIPADAPAGKARLLVGMYDPTTGDRLGATGPVDGLNRIHLTDLQIDVAP